MERMDKPEMAALSSREQTVGNWTKGRVYIGILGVAELSSAEISRMRIADFSSPELWGAQGLGFHVQELVAFVHSDFPPKFSIIWRGSY